MRAKAKVAEAPEPLPEWVGHKPITYELSCYAYTSREADQSNASGTIEQLDMSETEYMAVKMHLAKLRGFVVPEPEAISAS